MAKFISSAGIPEPYFSALVAFVRVPREKHISATELLSPPRPLALKFRHWDDLVIDVDHLIGAFYGGAAHAFIQAVHDRDEKRNPVLSRYLMEETLSMPQMGWAITGRPDLYQEMKPDELWEKLRVALPEDEARAMLTEKEWRRSEIGIVSDWKTMKSYSWGRQAADDYKRVRDQLELYGMLLRWSGSQPLLGYIGITITDWSQWGRGKGGSNYPPQTYIHVWHRLGDADSAVQLFADRFRIHREAAAVCDDDLPVCTREERWLREAGYAVQKDTNVRPSRVFKQANDAPEGTALHEAEAFVANQKKPEAYSIIHRPGECVRCQPKWCTAWQVCEEGQKFRPADFGQESKD
jgi:hypothetical protein